MWSATCTENSFAKSVITSCPTFLQDWERFKHTPLGPLAQSTLVRSFGHLENGFEKPNVRVMLASKIPPED
jgi:hypothetical protein